MIQHRARILLAEDDLTNQQATLAVLKNLGMHADAVANGQEAIAALEAAPYDLVLMDCQMPVLNGFEATKRIRSGLSKVHDHQVPVIALTASSILTERARCLECGMNDFLSKPVLPQTLFPMLAKWLPQDIPRRKNVIPPALPAPSEPSEQLCTTFLPIWDKQGMLARLLGDVGVAQRVIAGFLADLPIQMQSLETNLVQGDMLAIVRQAHSIKGAAAIVGGQRLRAAAMALEQSASKGHQPTLQALLEALRLEFAILQQKIQQFPALTGEETPTDHGTATSPSL